MVPNILGIQVIYAILVLEGKMTVEYFSEVSYIIFLAGRSMYLFLISSRLAISWVKESRSMTRHLTPSPSSAMMLAVRTWRGEDGGEDGRMGGSRGGWVSRGGWEGVGEDGRE